MNNPVGHGGSGQRARWVSPIRMLRWFGVLMLGSLLAQGGCGREGTEAGGSSAASAGQNNPPTTAPGIGGAWDRTQIGVALALAAGGGSLILSIVAWSLAGRAAKGAKAAAVRPIPAPLTIEEILRNPQFQQHLMAAVRNGVVEEQARLVMSLQAGQPSVASSTQATAAAKPAEQPQGPAPVTRTELKAVIRAITDLLESGEELSAGADGPSFAMASLLTRLPKDLGNVQERWCYVIAQLNTLLKDTPYPVLASPFIQMEQARSWDGKPNVRFTVKASAIAALCRVASKFDAKEQSNA